jgi:sulfur carrier protein ThiS
MRIHLGGHLSWYEPHKRSWLDVKLSEPTTLTAVLRKLGVPIEEIAVGALNGAAMTSLDNVRVIDADQVELFPPVGGG